MSFIRDIFTEFLPTAACHLAQRYKEVVTQGIDDRKYRPVHLTHFIPCTPFEQINADWIKDSLNEDRYRVENERTTRLKCLGLTAASPIVQAIGILLSVINRIVKLITLAHFWYPSKEEYSLCDRACSFGKDLLRVVFSPAIYVGLVISPFWGLAFTNNGRKLYATFERCIYGDALFAPCFQPEPTSHLGGADLSIKNAW